MMTMPSRPSPFTSNSIDSPWTPPLFDSKAPSPMPLDNKPNPHIVHRSPSTPPVQVKAPTFSPKGYPFPWVLSRNPSEDPVVVKASSTNNAPELTSSNLGAATPIEAPISSAWSSSSSSACSSPNNSPYPSPTITQPSLTTPHEHIVARTKNAGVTPGDCPPLAFEPVVTSSNKPNPLKKNPFAMATMAPAASPLREVVNHDTTAKESKRGGGGAGASMTA